MAEWYLNMYVNEVLRRGDTSDTWRTINNKLGGALRAASDPLQTVRARLSEVGEALFGSLCTDWHNKEKQDPPTTSGLPACPCTRRQANVDSRFEDDKACSNGGSGCGRFHLGAYHCICSVSARLVDKHDACVRAGVHTCLRARVQHAPPRDKKPPTP